MIVTCESCRTQFQLDDALVPESGVRVRCSRCKHAFYIDHPASGRSKAVQRRAEEAIEAAEAAAGPPIPDITQDLEPLTAPDPVGVVGPDPGASDVRELSIDPAESPREEPDESDWEFTQDIPPPDLQADTPTPAPAPAGGLDAARSAVEGLLRGNRATPAPSTIEQTEPIIERVSERPGDSGSVDSPEPDEADTGVWARGQMPLLSEAPAGSTPAAPDARSAADVLPPVGRGAEDDPDGVDPLAARSDLSGLDDELGADPIDLDEVDDPFDAALTGLEPAGEIGGPQSGDDLGSPESWDILSDTPPVAHEPTGTTYHAAREAEVVAAAEEFEPRDFQEAIPDRVPEDPTLAPSPWPGRLVAALGWTLTAALIGVGLYVGLRPPREIVAPRSVSVAAVDVGAVEGRFVENARVGLIYVVSGHLRTAPGAVGDGPIAVTLLDGSGVELPAPVALLGPELSDAAVREGDPGALRMRQAGRSRSLVTRPFARDERRPFDAVFQGLPPEAVAFRLTALSAERARELGAEGTEMRPDVAAPGEVSALPENL